MASAYYFDASVAVKAYSEEEGSDLVEEFLDCATEIYLSRIGTVEVAAAFFGKTKTGEIELEEAVALLEEFRVDLELIYRIVEVEAGIVDRSIAVAEKHHLRAYDCLQLATALLIQEQRAALQLEPLTFASADRELNAAATSEGMVVKNPGES